MKDSRAAILGGIRSALRRDALSAESKARLETRISEPPKHIRPKFSETVRERFISKLHEVTATTSEVASRGAVPGAVVDYLRSNELPFSVVLAPALEDLDWPPELSTRFGRAERDDPVAVTPCLAAVAETGTVVLLSNAESPTTLNFLPEDHIVVVDANQLVAHIDDVWPLLRAVPDGVPRTVNLISGPSKTADVEQTIQYGAHGPRRFHVVLVGD
jgi:L-lactate dehydrogenase complex protein LldG